MLHENDYFYGETVYGDYCYIPEEYMDEKWWFINGAPGYMISDHGRVWSGKTQSFIKPKPMDAHGHMGVCLCINGKHCYEYIHRLMANAFICNPNNLPVVRHLNDNPRDNNLDNLAWGTQKDNYIDSVRNGTARPLTAEIREIGLNKLRKPIIATNLKTGEQITFRGQCEASNFLGIQQANIWKVLNGERMHAGGYYFEYLKEDGVSDD